MITQVAPDSLSMGALFSPVKAPLSFGKKFCAATSTWPPSSSLDTAASAVNGGETTTSTSPATSFEANCTAAASSTPFKPPLFSFQLPAIRYLRATLASSQGFDARQLETFDELERRTAARRNESNFLGQAS